MPDKKATVITIGMSEEEFAKLEEKTRKMLQSADAEWQVTLLRCDTLADAAEKAPKLDRLDFVYFNNDSFVGTCTRDERDAQLAMIGVIEHAHKDVPFCFPDKSILHRPVLPLAIIAHWQDMKAAEGTRA